MLHDQPNGNRRQVPCSFRRIGSLLFAVWSMVILLLGSPTYAQRSSDLKPVLNVFLQAGQSNMAGADAEVAVPPGFQQTTADRDTLFTTAPLPDGDQSKQKHAVEVTVTSPLPKGNVPMNPAIDCGQIIREHGGSGVLDPNSFEVINLASGMPVPFARSEDFAYGDRGRLEWVVTDPTHTKFEVRFRFVAGRPALEPQEYTPLIGVGDLLRYNAGQPRAFALPYPARLVDLTGDGKLDLVGCWNYAYRPGWPSDGIVCYPRVGDPEQFEFGDLTRLRYVTKPDSTDYQHFVNIYMWADFADFDGDGLVDIVWCSENNDHLRFYRNTGRRDEGGMPAFVEAGSLAKKATGRRAAGAVAGRGIEQFPHVVESQRRGFAAEVRRRPAVGRSAGG